MFRVTVDDGGTVFDLDVEDEDLPAVVTRLLVTEEHQKLVANRLSPDDAT